MIFFYILIECVCIVCQASEDLLREHYWELRSKPFFQGLMSYMSSGPIVAMVSLPYTVQMYTGY